MYMIVGSDIAEDPRASKFPRSAAAVTALYAVGLHNGPEVARGLDYLATFAPPAFDPDYYYYGQYYAAQAFWQAGGGRFDRWYGAAGDDLIARQRPDGSCRRPAERGLRHGDGLPRPANAEQRTAYRTTMTLPPSTRSKGMNRRRNWFRRSASAGRPDRLHPRRTAGGDCHHWNLDCAVVARRAGGAGGGAADALLEQPEADRHRVAQLLDAHKSFPTDRIRTPRHGWCALLLPFLEQKGLQTPTTSTTTTGIARTKRPPNRRCRFFCAPRRPADRSSYRTTQTRPLTTSEEPTTESMSGDYQALVGYYDPVQMDPSSASGMLHTNRGRPRDVLDGLSNSLCVSELAGRPEYYAGREVRSDSDKPAWFNEWGPWAAPQRIFFSGFTHDGLTRYGPLRRQLQQPGEHLLVSPGGRERFARRRLRPLPERDRARSDRISDDQLPGRRSRRIAVSSSRSRMIVLLAIRSTRMRSTQEMP